ncbi:uncharacterized protein LOC108859841 [Raphanus sativus]|uniref:Uncharacterized protein LOC108859841 n=1 Tax=Raphanus sativus TaxID=3726 RepID=A0A6J0NY97_RAPSA|nr:uncharacterized protein LOC108859841 [Raphanus sativus]
MDQNKSNQEAKAKEAETAKIGLPELNRLTEDSSCSVEDESNWEKEAAIASLSEAAKKMVPSRFAAFVDKVKGVPELDLLRFNYYLVDEFSQVSSLPWFNMLKKSPLSDVPLSHIPKSVYETAAVWINQLPFETQWKFVSWALNRLLIDWEAHATGQEQTFSKSQVATLVELAMVLRARPGSLTCHLLMLRGRPKYHSQDNLPLILWMMTQAFQDDLPAALYSWALNLLPLVFNNNCSSHSIDLILQFAEMMLSSNPEARAVLLNEPVRHGQRLIPPSSFEMLVRLTFPAPSARVASTERFQAIYPLLKEVALAPDTITCADALKQIFTFSLKLAAAGGQEGNPALANEATAIAISVLTQNVACFKQWDVLYKENLEASVALLRKLVDEWEDHSLIKLSSSPTDALTVIRAMNSFRTKNKKALGVDRRLGLAPSFTTMVTASEELSLSVKDESDWEETEKAIVSLSEAAKKIDPSPLATFLDEVLNEDWYHPERQILKLIDYYGIELSKVSFQWVNMFEEYPLSKLIHVPLSLIPMPVIEKTLDFINILPLDTLLGVVLWASDLILTEWPGVVKVEQLNSDKSKVATFVVLAMVLRTKPDALTLVLQELREGPTCQGQDKFRLLIWMMSQTSQGDLPAGLYSWVRNLLPPLVANYECYSSQSIDLILQPVEMMLSSNPEARAVLLNEPVRHGERLIPPSSFEMLVRLTFPAPSARVASTERFEAIYPLLKEVALEPDTITCADALKQIFTFSLKLAGGQEGNPALANEATAIAISVLTQNVDCFKQWDVLYKENLEASVALLGKLVDEWEDHSLKLSSHTLTVRHAMNRFRRKNKKAITDRVANLSLYKEADQSCKLISTRLSLGPGIASFASMVIEASEAAARAALVNSLI